MILRRGRCALQGGSQVFYHHHHRPGAGGKLLEPLLGVESDRIVVDRVDDRCGNTSFDCAEAILAAALDDPRHHFATGAPIDSVGTKPFSLFWS